MNKKGLAFFLGAVSMYIVIAIIGVNYGGSVDNHCISTKSFRELPNYTPIIGDSDKYEQRGIK